VWVLSDFQYGFILGLCILPLTPICGVGFAVAAWVRHEKYQALPWIGLLLNLVVMYFIFGQLFSKGSHFIGSMG
jgi:hypothetical protein